MPLLTVGNTARQRHPGCGFPPGKADQQATRVPAWGPTAPRPPVNEGAQGSADSGGKGLILTGGDTGSSRVTVSPFPRSATATRQGCSRIGRDGFTKISFSINHSAL